MSAHRRFVSRVTALCALLCFALLLAGCVRISPPPPEPVTTTPEPPAPNTGTTLTVAASAMGVPLTTGSWQITPTSARTRAKLPNGTAAKAGKTLLYLEVQFNNVRMAESLIAKPDYFTLKDAATGKKMPTVSTDNGYNLHGMRRVDPAYGGMTVFIYEIPKKPGDYVFSFFMGADNRQTRRLSWLIHQ